MSPACVRDEERRFNWPSRKRPFLTGAFGSNSDVAPIGLRFGLPAYRRRRLPKVDRRGDRDDVTAHLPWDISLQRRLSPAVPGEESGWLLPESFVRSQLQIRGVTRGGEGVTIALIWIP